MRSSFEIPLVMLALSEMTKTISAVVTGGLEYVHGSVLTGSAVNQRGIQIRTSTEIKIIYAT